MVHAKVYGLILAVLMILFWGMIVDSRIRNDPVSRLRDLRAISLVVPSADPGMDNSARYIRHLALSTPGSAFPDYPGQPDYLPAGMVWPPPLLFLGMSDQIELLQPAVVTDGK